MIILDETAPFQAAELLIGQYAELGLHFELLFDKRAIELRVDPHLVFAVDAFQPVLMTAIELP
jgi:hypothetical protein